MSTVNLSLYICTPCFAIVLEARPNLNIILNLQNITLAINLYFLLSSSSLQVSSYYCIIRCGGSFAVKFVNIYINNLWFHKLVVWNNSFGFCSNETYRRKLWQYKKYVVSMIRGNSDFFYNDFLIRKSTKTTCFNRS